MNEFERQLQRQPFREIPPDWKADILGAVESQRELRPATNAGRGNENGLSMLPHTTRWKEWLWPAPAAWAALVALWSGLFALYLATPEPRRAVVVQPAPLPVSAPRGSLLAFQAQHRLVAEVGGLPNNLH